MRAGRREWAARGEADWEAWWCAGLESREVAGSRCERDVNRGPGTNLRERPFLPLGWVVGGLARFAVRTLSLWR